MKVWIAHEADWDYGAHVAIAATLERAKRVVEERWTKDNLRSPHPTPQWEQSRLGTWEFDTYSVWEEEVLE
jgi:hypothetical protein